jgi:hypothetical protein
MKRQQKDLMHVLHRLVEFAAKSRHSALEAFENNANLPLPGLWRL